MESEIGAILGLCFDGWWLGWLSGISLPCTEAVYPVKILMSMCTGCISTEVYRP